MKEYVAYCVLLITGLLCGAWLNARLQPVVELPWVQQSLITAMSALFGYVILVWGYLLVVSLFGTDSKGPEYDSKAGTPTSLLSQLITIGALVGIPLSLIVGSVINSV